MILSQPYTAAVDMWSLGCIFGELLGMQFESQPNYRMRRPLFPGERYGVVVLVHAHDQTFVKGQYFGVSSFTDTLQRD